MPNFNPVPENISKYTAKVTLLNCLGLQPSASVTSSYQLDPIIKSMYDTHVHVYTYNFVKSLLANLS